MDSFFLAQAKIHCIGQAKQKQYNYFAKKFETKLTQWYPFGQQAFRLDHGTNYFAFFNRMGVPYHYALFHTKDISIDGTLCFVFRKINQNNYVFYLCDLKFNPLIRKKGMLRHLLLRSIPFCLLKTTKFYAISMNNETTINGGNNILDMAKHMGHTNFGKIKVNIEKACNLNLYSFNYEQMCRFEKYIAIAKKNVTSQKIRYLSLKNVKDLIIQDENKNETPMNLLHMHYFISEYDDLSIGSYYTKPKKGYTHMFCTVANGVLARFLETKHNILPDSTATVMHHNLVGLDWEFLQTCDI